MELHGQQMTFNKKKDWNCNYMDFNRILMTLQNKHGIQDGITWTTNDFQQKELELHELQ
jgi:hypothetical protein